jgi:flagellum-specific ATP synthase
VQAGLYERGTDPETDAAIASWPRLDAFVAMSAPEGIAASFEALRQSCDGDESQTTPSSEGEAGAA